MMRGVKWKKTKLTKSVHRYAHIFIASVHVSQLSNSVSYLSMTS